MLEFGANADQCAEYARGNEQERKASEESPCRQQNRSPSGVQFGKETHRFSQARELNLIEVLLMRATSLSACRVASSVGRATDF